MPSYPLIPENDPSTLFTSSGMQPLIPYLLGEKHPLGTRLVDSQKCFRAEDVDEVGDNRHTCFFEMLGNWSLGEYFKNEQLPWYFEFLIKEIGLDPKRLYVTVFSGDEENGIPKDDEAVALWQKNFKSAGIETTAREMITLENAAEIGMGDARIFYYNSKKNWWSRSGTPDKMPEGEIGGPDSEVFYDFGTPHDPAFGKECHPNCDCGRFVELGNSVFITYRKVGGKFEKLAQRNVDFGGGLERTTAASIGDPDIFMTDLYQPAIREMEKLSGKSYTGANSPSSAQGELREGKREMRIIADHMRAASFMIADGIIPGNTEQAYILRRLIRRSVRYSDKLGLPANTLLKIVPFVLEPFAGVYPEIVGAREKIQQVVDEEEVRFRETLTKGMKMFEKVAGSNISGEEAFILFTTYGFPIEVTDELAKERGLTVDMAEFGKKMAEHKELSRTSSAGKFKGGLAEHSEITTAYHTLTHMLGAALRIVLGPHITQRGSNITSERLRFDFSHGAKMTDEEKKRVEDIVNEKITAKLPVSMEVLSTEEARKRGAIGAFGDKYGDSVKVYKIGDDATGVYSYEICGGPHIENTGEVEGRFKILKEEAVAAGIRRIKAVIE